MSHSATLREIESIPKLEMHIHLEGTIQPERVAAMAAARGEELPRPLDKLYLTQDLTDFLSTLDWVCSLVDSEQQVRDIAMDFARYCHEQNIIYSEVIINPTHWRGLPYEQLLPALNDAFDDAQQLGLADIRLLPSLLRQQSSAAAIAMVQWIGERKAAGWLNRVLGLSVDGNEAAAGPSAEKFAAAYALAKNLGLGCTAHAGESSGAEGVLEALDLLGAQRIDHGVRAIEDRAVVERLVRDKITLNICLSSNCTLLYPGIDQHPIVDLVKAGVLITLNTDDPVVLKKTLNTELAWAADELGWSIEQLKALQLNAVYSAFCDDARKAQLYEQLQAPGY